MKTLEDRAAAIGVAAKRRKIAEIEQALGAMGIKAAASGDKLTLSGKGLVKRWLNEASLRFITGPMR